MSKKIWLTTMTGLGLLAGASLAQACTTGAWSASSGDAVAGGPAQATVLPRYSGTCAMQATAGYVQDNSPANETQMITRFYVLPEGSGDADIYTTYSDETGTTAVYTVSYDGTAGELVFTTTGGGSVSAAVDVGSWNSVETNWTASGTMNIWVNADAATAASTTSVAAGSGAGIDSARLGAQSTTGTVNLVFDDYEARRTTSVGRLTVCDANASGSVTIADAVTVLLELGGTFATGQPDCNENGSVTIADAVTALLLL